MASAEPAVGIDGIEIADLAAQDYLGRRFTSDIATVGRDVQAGFKQLYEHLARVRSRPLGPPFLIASQPRDGVIQIELGAPCTPPPEPAEGLHAGRLDAGRAAVARYRGPYEGIGAVYEKVFTWITRNGYRPAGAPREVYLNGPDEVRRPEDYLTEVVVPIE